MRLSRFVAAALLSLLLSGYLHAQIYPPGQAPTLDDIIRAHAEFKDSIRTARITATWESRPSPAFLEEIIKRRASELFASEDARPADFYDTERIFRTGPRNVFEVVDLDAVSYKYVTTDPRDLNSLIRENGLGDYAREKLLKTELTATVGGRNYSYDSASNVLHILPGSPPSTHLGAGTLVDLHYPTDDITITPDPDDPSLYHMTFSEPLPPGSPPDALPMRYEYVLDASVGFRVVSRRTFTREGRRLDAEYEYSDFNGFTVPRSYRLTSYAEDGSLLASYSYEYISVEVNVPIDPSEFTLDVPPDAAVFDETGEPAAEACEDFPFIARELADDALASPESETPPAPEDPGSNDLTSELYPPGQPAPAATSAPPRDRTLLLALLLAAALLLALVALRLLKRRKRP